MRVVTLPDPHATQPPPTFVFPRELRFELLDPGEGARSRLRYRGGGAARELLARAVVTTRQYAHGDWSDTITLAPVQDGFGITPGAAGTSHLRGLAGQIEEAGASRAAQAGGKAYLARWRALLEGARADVAADDRGRFVSASMIGATAATERDAREELVQRWLALAVPVPAEPVGIGARWRAVIALRAGGTVLKQDATYTLTARDGDAWTVDVAIERLGEPQQIFVPGAAPDDATVIGELIGMRRMVSGTLVVGPSDPLPLRGTLHAEVTSHARLQEGPATDEQVSEDQATIVIGPAPLPVQ